MGKHFWNGKGHPTCAESIPGKFKMKSTAIFTYLLLISVCVTTLHGLPSRFARQADVENEASANDIALEEEIGDIQDVENNIEKNVEIMEEEKVTDESEMKKED